MKNVYAAFDLSLAKTGAVAIDQKGRVLERLTIETDTSKPYHERIEIIADRVVDFMRAHQPDMSAIEEMAMFASFNSGTIFPLHGAVIYAIRKAGLAQPVRISATTIKKFVTGSGRAEKSDMKMGVLEKWSEKFTDDNQCDAYAAAQLIGAVHGGIKTAHKYEAECVKTVAAKLAEARN